MNFLEIKEVLSQREMDVLLLIVEGFQNKSIAEKLYISVKTVEFHKENIKQKLGISKVSDLYELQIEQADS